MVKRYRKRTPKPGQLIAYYGRLDGDSPDVVFAWGGGGANSRHGALLHYIFGSARLELANFEENKRSGREWIFGKSALQRLEEAGFDLSTLRFSIELKSPPAPAPAPAEQLGTESSDTWKV